MEKRIAIHQELLAKEVVTEARRQISICNLHYTGSEGSILKRRACDAISDALEMVLKKRSEMYTK